MRSIHFLTALVILVASGAPYEPARAQQPSAQQLDDVVYLKDGTIVRGMIVEQRPGESILIRARDGNQFRFRMDQVERMTKEASVPAAVPAPAAAPVVLLNQKSSGTAALFSVLLPGAGQAYTGDWGDAIFFSVGTWFPFAMVNKLTRECSDFEWDDCKNINNWATAGVIMYAWNIIDAAVGADQFNRKAAGLASLSIRPWIEVAHAPGGPAESPAFRALSGPAGPRLQVGVLRLKW